MTIAFVITLVVLGIVMGYAARQRQDLIESDAKIEEQEQTITRLRRENASLTEENAAHVSSLEMVLDHNADKSA